MNVPTEEPVQNNPRDQVQTAINNTTDTIIQGNTLQYIFPYVCLTQLTLTKEFLHHTALLPHTVMVNM